MQRLKIPLPAEPPKNATAESPGLAPAQNATRENLGLSRRMQRRDVGRMQRRNPTEVAPDQDGRERQNVENADHEDNDDREVTLHPFLGRSDRSTLLRHVA